MSRPDDEATASGPLLVKREQFDSYAPESGAGLKVRSSSEDRQVDLQLKSCLAEASFLSN